MASWPPSTRPRGRFDVPSASMLVSATSGSPSVRRSTLARSSSATMTSEGSAGTSRRGPSGRPAMARSWSPEPFETSSRAPPSRSARSARSGSAEFPVSGSCSLLRRDDIDDPERPSSDSSTVRRIGAPGSEQVVGAADVEGVDHRRAVHPALELLQEPQELGDRRGPPTAGRAGVDKTGGVWLGAGLVQVAPTPSGPSSAGTLPAPREQAGPALGAVGRQPSGSVATDRLEHPVQQEAGLAELRLPDPG